MDKTGEKGQVSLDITQVVSVLTIAMGFTGLSIQLARFHSQSRRGLMCETKIPMQELWLKMGGRHMDESL